MIKKNDNKHEPDSSLMALFHAIISDEPDRISRLLAKSPELARQALGTGASRQSETPYFFRQIMHYVYAGDTALHVAAAAYQQRLLENLSSKVRGFAPEIAVGRNRSITPLAESPARPTGIRTPRRRSSNI